MNLCLKNLLINNRTKTYGLIFLTALLLRVIGIFVYGVDYSGDSVEYDTIACNIVQGHGYSLSQSPPFKLTTHREPTYPLFLALIYRIFGHNTLMVVIIQCLIGSLTCVLIYKTALEIYDDDRVAFLATLINAFYLPIAIFNLRLYSETIAILLVAIIAYNLVQILKKKENWVNYLCLGITTGILILNKLVFQFFPFFILIVIMILSKGKKVVGKNLVCLLLAAIVVFPWLLFNKRVHDSYDMGHSVRMGGIFFYTRVANDGMAYPLEMEGNLYGKFLELELSGIDTSGINAEYIHKAIDIIRKHPLRYVAGIFLEIKNLWRFSVHAGEIDTSNRITLQGVRGKIYLSIKYIFLIVNFVILFTGIAGFFMKIGKKSGALMSIIFYSTLIYVLICRATPRLNVPVLQLMIILSAYFMVKVYDRNINIHIKKQRKF